MKLNTYIRQIMADPGPELVKDKSNEFSKLYVWQLRGIEIHVARAEQDGVPFLMIVVPSMPFLAVTDIKYPIPFPSEEARDEAYEKFEPKTFLDSLIKHITDNQKKQNLI